MPDYKEHALHRFWSSFGLKAFDETTVPDNALIDNGGAIITYGVSTSTFEDPVPLHASIWYRDKDWTEITAKCNEISAAIGYGGKRVPFDSGYLWICRGVPFAQRMADDNDQVRRIYLNIMIEFHSVN